MAMRSSITFLAIALFASGCAHYPVNAPLAAVDGRTGYRVQNALRLRILAPWNTVRLFSPTFNRSDLAAEYYDRLLFKGATFGDLAARPGAPFLIINSTDLTSGSRFEFTQDQFDFLKSDLSQFP